MKKKNALGILSVALCPFLRLMQLYDANPEELLLTHVLLLGCLISAVALLVYLVARRLFHSHLAAVLLGLEVAMVLCFFSGVQFLAIQIADFLHMKRLWLSYLLIAVPLSGLSLLLILLGKKLPGEANIFFALFVAVLLAMNLIPIVSRELQKVQGFEYKTEFTVDAATSSPNIYWFHCDGMLNTDTVRQYFGYEATDFKTRLAQQGFTIFPDATLEANRVTHVATAVLMCPYYYDERLRTLCENSVTHGEALAYTRANYLENWTARYYNEVLGAFTQKGYLTHLLSLYNNHSFLSEASRFYAITDHDPEALVNRDEYPFLVEKSRYTDKGEREQLANLGYLVFGSHGKKWFPLLLPGVQEIRAPLPHLPTSQEVSDLLFGNPLAIYHYRALVQSLYDELQTGGEPRFTLIHYMPSHYPFTLSLDGTLPNPENGKDVVNFPKAYEYATAVLMNLTDMVLEKDPDAIILLVGDHGIHTHEFVPQLTSLFGKAALPDLWNNIFYAVRLPGKWASQLDLSMLSEPRNLGRYLVNTFVGPNYDYIKP